MRRRAPRAAHADRSGEQEDRQVAHRSGSEPDPSTGRPASATPGPKPAERAFRPSPGESPLPRPAPARARSPPPRREGRSESTRVRPSAAAACPATRARPRPARARGGTRRRVDSAPSSTSRARRAAAQATIGRFRARSRSRSPGAGSGSTAARGEGLARRSRRLRAQPQRHEQRHARRRGSARRCASATTSDRERDAGTAQSALSSPETRSPVPHRSAQSRARIRTSGSSVLGPEKNACAARVVARARNASCSPASSSGSITQVRLAQDERRPLHELGGDPGPEGEAAREHQTRHPAWADQARGPARAGLGTVNASANAESTSTRATPTRRQAQENEDEHRQAGSEHGCEVALVGSPGFPEGEEEGGGHEDRHRHHRRELRCPQTRAPRPPPRTSEVPSRAGGVRAHRLERAARAARWRRRKPPSRSLDGR
jgi:hypothetical protein